MYSLSALSSSQGSGARSSSRWQPSRPRGAQFSVRRGLSDNIAKPLRGEFVSGNYFATFGIHAYAGRTITPSDDQASAPPVAMLSYRAWQQQYDSDPSVVGSTFIVEGHPFTIAGIAPPGFFGETLRSNPPELWLPLQQEPLLNAQNSLLRQSISAWLRVIGRLKPGASTDGNSATAYRAFCVNGWCTTADIRRVHASDLRVAAQAKHQNCSRRVRA